MAAFDPIEFFGISPNREAPFTGKSRERSQSSSSTTSSISLQPGLTDHKTLLLPTPVVPELQPQPCPSTTLMTLEPEDMTWDLEASALTHVIRPPLDGPVPLERFLSARERHEQLALSLHSPRKRTKRAHQRHPPHTYAQPSITSNININRYLTDNADQHHELLAYKLEQLEPAHPPSTHHGHEPDRSQSQNSSISLGDVVVMPASSPDDASSRGKRPAEHKGEDANLDLEKLL
ncbi:hypothetical protein QBC44DRAFT_384349 [Cladorrhinum sp. PSN332]|nr:hypothetical protein QBC44DRAFT_384349 [Cladorrhinum sp. PSN332]